jgi:sialate O-acetylesterase
MDGSRFPVRRIACVLLLCGVAARADVRLPSVFGSNMILQRDAPVRVWGWAGAGERVEVGFAGHAAQATAGTDGTWRVELPACKAGVRGVLNVRGANSLSLTNVTVGDVWICSGQSNMEFTLGGTQRSNDVAAADFPDIRCLRIAHENSATQEADFGKPVRWEVCSPATAGRFTAVGYHFAVTVQAAGGTPIGLIDCSWGGSQIEPYLTPVGLTNYPDLLPLSSNLLADAAQYRRGLPALLDQWERWIPQARAALAADATLPKTPASLVPPTADAGRLHAKYNAMVAPLTVLPVCGWLWYQGESNGGEGESYRTKMRALIEGWRAAWGQGELPFYLVQLANYQAATTSPAGADGWARLREAQLRTFREVPRTGLAVIVDIGEAADIHPKNKADVGMRLAQWALRDVYGLPPAVVSGPLFREMKAEDGAIRISFDFTGSGLMVGRKPARGPAVEDPEGALKRFAVAGEDRVWNWADARIEGDTVVVRCPAVPQPVAVRYAFSMNPEGANLYNREGLPASPFRTDTW